MSVSEAKRFEYWNHFIARWAIDRVGGGHGVTGPRLHKIRASIMNDDRFWWDIVLRHDGDHVTPEEMAEKMPNVYAHCLGNFWGGIYQDLVAKRLVK